MLIAIRMWLLLLATPGIISHLCHPQVVALLQAPSRSLRTEDTTNMILPGFTYSSPVSVSVVPDASVGNFP